jgi:hypothetical protein
MLAQIRAITIAQRPSDEVITADIIRSVARDSLKQAQPVLQALRTGNTEYLLKVPDINPLGIDDFVQSAQKILSTTNPKTKEKPIPYGQLRSSKKSNQHKRKAKKTNRPPVDAEGDLRAAAKNAQSSNKSVYEQLKEAGHVGGISESTK